MPDSDSDPQLGDVDAELSEIAIERVIPIRFFVFDDNARPCPQQITQPIIDGAVEEANRVFRPTGVQFRSIELKRFNAPSFRDVSFIGTRFTWDTAAWQLAGIDPAIGTFTYSGWGSRSAEEWMDQIGWDLSHSDIKVFVPCMHIRSDGGDGGHASFPSSGNHQRLHINAAGFGTPSSAGTGTKQRTLAHELGHYFDLPHTFEIHLRPQDVSFYDQFFARAPSGDLKVFSSTEEMTGWDLGALLRKPKDGWVAPGSPACRVADSSCDVVCNLNGWAYSTSTYPDVVYPIGLTYSNGDRGINIMSYLSEPAGSPYNCRSGLGVTQIARVKQALRSTVGDRHLLGRLDNPLAPGRRGLPGTDELDFDGDKKRDVAVWNAQYRECRVKTATGADMVIDISTQARSGDEPVLGDFDGDGFTDCAVYRRGVGAAKGLFIHSRSRTGPTCCGTVLMGGPGAVPLTGLRMLGSASQFGRVGTFTPSTNTFEWQTGTTTSTTRGFGQKGDQLALADYDGDGKTDLAVWRPNPATFWVTGSANNFATMRSFSFGAATDVVVGPVRRDTGAATDFALWDPTTGVWRFLMNPWAGTGAVQTQGWGEPGDQPIGSFDMDNDGRSDLVIYRAPRSSVSSSQFWILGSTVGVRQLNIGERGDLPIVTRDRNGDGKGDLILYRPSTSTFWSMPSNADLTFTRLDRIDLGRPEDAPF